MKIKNYYITKNGQIIGTTKGTVADSIKAVEKHFKIKGQYELIDNGNEVLIKKCKNIYGIHKT